MPSNCDLNLRTSQQISLQRSNLRIRTSMHMHHSLSSNFVVCTLVPVNQVWQCVSASDCYRGIVGHNNNDRHRAAQQYSSDDGSTRFSHGGSSLPVHAAFYNTVLSWPEPSLQHHANKAEKTLKIAQDRLI